MPTELRNTGIRAVGSIPWGTHFCHFYETRQDLLDTLVPYFKTGLEHNEFCLWIVAHPLGETAARNGLKQAISDANQYLSAGRIEIVPYTSLLSSRPQTRAERRQVVPRGRRRVKTGTFVPQQVIDSWREKAAQALQAGYAGMRVNVNNSWLTDEHWTAFAQFEHTLDEKLAHHHTIVLCSYPLMGASATQILDVAHTHHFVIAKRDDRWEILETPELKQAKQSLQRLNAELEERIARRTQKLAAANRNLRQEIAERKRAEEALRRSEANFRSLAEKSLQGIVIFQDQRVVYTNPAHAAILGYSVEEIEAMSAEDTIALLHPLEPSAAKERLRKHVAGEELSQTVELRFVRKDGSTCWIQSLNNVIEYNGRPAVFATTIDVTERKKAEEAARDSQQLVRLVLDTLPVGVSVVDRAGDIVLINDASKRIWGGKIVSGRERWARTNAFWHNSHQRIAPAEWASVQALSEGQTRLNELIDVETFAGEQKILRNSVAPIRNAGASIVGAVMVNEDVTERVRAEEEVRRQAARAETLARIAARLNKQLDLDAVIQAVCGEVVDTFGVSQATISLYDKERDQLVYAGGVNMPPQYAAMIEPVSRAQFEEFVRTVGPILVVPDIQALPNVPSPEFTIEMDVRTVVTADVRREQELIGVLALGVNGHVREFDKNELALLKSISDQAAQAVANAQLLKDANKQREQLRTLSAKLVEAQETERRAVARELHDQIGQVLTAVNADLQALQLSAKATRQTERLEASLHSVGEAIQKVRDLSLDLRPSLLDEFGLGPALEWYLHRQAERFGFRAKLVVEPTELRLSPELETTVFRVAQIALTNVERHAHAKRVEVKVGLQKRHVKLVIHDDGVGFDVPAALERAARGDSLGLLSLQERVHLTGGTVDIESARGHGTEIRAVLPLEEP